MNSVFEARRRMLATPSLDHSPIASPSLFARVRLPPPPMRPCRAQGDLVEGCDVEAEADAALRVARAVLEHRAHPGVALVDALGSRRPWECGR